MMGDRKQMSWIKITFYIYIINQNMGKFLPFIRSHSFGWMYNGMVPIVICTPHMTSDTDYMYVGGGVTLLNLEFGHLVNEVMSYLSVQLS